MGDLTRLPDGTVKQINPFTGTHVWTAPGRGNRPIHRPPDNPRALRPGDADRECAFCPARYLETPPEKARLVRQGQRWRMLHDLPAEHLFDTLAEFRVIPNLFAILGLDYWRINHGYVIPEHEMQSRRRYFATPAGREQVMSLVARHDPTLLDRGDEAIVTSGLLGGFHDVIVARRHYTDGAEYADQLASSGTLTPDEHAHFMAVTRDAALRLYEKNPHAANVIAFQNWLAAAGASFDHLHKQIVAIDDIGGSRLLDQQRLQDNPRLVQDYLDTLRTNDLIVARAPTAIAVASYGHRFPTLEVWLLREDCDLADLTPQEVDDFSALVHACHVAMGPHLPMNEEWHYRAPSQPDIIPVRALLKWRISTPAGFEGNSRIYVNTIDPWGVAARTRAWMEEQAARLHPAVRIVEGR